ncbi:MAG TPA: hypothetical protein VEU29_01240, partial [Actinomycetota bacterium]|nr:hypothetical protein [Actinomycetota bacterium]
MIKGNRVLAGFVLAMLVAGALSGAAAVAEEGVEQNEALEQDAVLELVEDAGEQEATPPAAEEPTEPVPTDDGDA